MIDLETRRRYRWCSFIFASCTQLFKHIRDFTDGIKVYRPAINIPAAPKETLDSAMVGSDSS